MSRMAPSTLPSLASGPADTAQTMLLPRRLVAFSVACSRPDSPARTRQIEGMNSRMGRPMSRPSSAFPLASVDRRPHISSAALLHMVTLWSGSMTITADLSGKLPRGTTRIRITTNLEIYWVSILIDRSQPSQNFKLNAIPLTKASLGYHGYPRQIEDQPPGNVKYVYEQVSRTGPYARQAGTYTRYGDVLPLLKAFDDKLVVFGSGEEVALEFDPAKLPPLPKGWTRDYFFMANGYEKDMDFYAADGSTVEPLPFRRMGTYPYAGKSFPADDDHLKYMLEFNTRFVSGNEPRGYAYEYAKPAAK